MKKEGVLFILMGISFAGLLFSRALLSFSAGCWLIWVLMHYKTFAFAPYKTLLAWGITPLLLALMGCWQNGFAKEDVSLLLTLCIYPVVTLSISIIDHHYPIHQPVFSKLWILLAMIALIYPVSWYLLHMQEAFTRYGSGQTAPVWMDNDHVRFGIFLSIAALLAWQYRKQEKWISVTFYVLLTGILFLAIRTAWVMTIGMSMVIAVFYLLKGNHQQKKNVLFSLLAMIVIVTTAWFLFPSIQQKIAYTIYDWQQSQSGNIHSNLSDATRKVMNTESWKLIQSGQANIGWSEIAPTLRSAVSVSYPQQVFDFGWPFNQWLFWWIGSGLIGMILFSSWLLYPIMEGWRRQNIGLICLTVGIALSCLVETNLGYQFGAWLHAWSIALLWKRGSCVISTPGNS